MRILLLEDEESIRGFVRINLKRNGMDVTEAEDGETALALAAEANPPFDVALLDVMLPTISGFEVCGKLREQFPRMGIIMLTAKSQEEDKIRGLELGADDYVQKPFSPGELIARLGALHRRMMPGGLSWPDETAAAASTEERSESKVHVSANSEHGVSGTPGSGAEASGGVSTTLPHPDGTSLPRDTNNMHEDSAASSLNGTSHGSPEADIVHSASGTLGAAGELSEGPFRLSSAERRLWKGREEVVLTPTEWTLVKLLMERAGEGLSRDDILNAVWGRHFIGDLKIVDVNIRRIRQKMEDNPSEPRYIETLWGYGYRWKRSDGQ